MFQGIIDAIDAVILHGKKETGRKLGLGSTCIEKSRRGMGKPFLRHEIVRLKGRIEIFTVDADGTIRFSLSYFNDEEDIDQAVKAITEISEF